MNQANYQEGLEEFLQYGEKLIGDNLLPYAGEISGEWKASTIKEDIKDSYARATRLYHPGFPLANPHGRLPAREGENIEDISGELSRQISDEIFNYFSHHGKGVIFVIDFSIFKKDIANKLLAIQRKYQN
jgi:hypothetical protein